MGILRGMLGQASEIDAEKLESDFEAILGEGEQIEKAYKIVRDLIVFTNLRLVFVDKKGITGKKTAYHSIPYKTISHFIVETAGHFDLDAELYIFVIGVKDPYHKEFKKGSAILEVQQALATYTLRAK